MPVSEAFSRTEMLLGAEAMERLKNARVAVFGIGGVGGHLTEALARSGVGALELIDGDEFAESNLNRQLFALRSTIGTPKVEAAAARLRDIVPDCEVRIRRDFFTPENAGKWDFTQYDYVADAIDSVAGKLALVKACFAAGTPILCAMGAGNKLDPTAFRVADLSKTKVCPLARIMRTELRKQGIEHLKVVYSEELPVKPAHDGMRPIPGSTAFVPGVMGMIMAGEIVRDLIKKSE